jgi:hypothetical protein
MTLDGSSASSPNTQATPTALLAAPALTPSLNPGDGRTPDAGGGRVARVGVVEDL